MIIAIIGIVFLIVLYLLLFWGISNQIEEYQVWKEKISESCKIHQDLENKNDFLKMDIDLQDKRIDEKLNYIKQLNENIQASEETAIRCQKSYTEILEENYANAEKEYDNNQEKLKEAYNNLQDNLLLLKLSIKYLAFLLFQLSIPW